MDFSEKLGALLTLTGTKNAQLADALGIGRPYVSRLKTGERRMPTNRQIICDMSCYFAARCVDDYRRRALKEFTNDPRIDNTVSEPILAEVVYDWLIGTSPIMSTPARHFLSSVSLYAANGVSDVPSSSEPLAGKGVYAYYKKEGKRQALKDLFAYAETIGSPCRMLLFTDESYDWLIEDDAYTEWLNAELRAATARGMTFERIQPPFSDVAFTFSAIERWLPGYVVGAVQQFHYPYPRDRLLRRSIFVIPNHIALCSDSTCGETEPSMTMLTRDPSMVEVYERQYAAIRNRCRSALTTCNAESPNLFSMAETLASIEDDGVYKTDALSINTLPPEVVERIRHHGTPFALKLAESFEIRAKARANVLVAHTITDILYLPDLATVLAGREPIPGTSSMPDGPLYYTPTEYLLHLKRIRLYMSIYQNYRVVLTDDALERNLILITKGDRRALLVKTTAPFAVFNVTEPMMAAAFCDYQRRIVETKTGPGARQATIERLSEEIARLEGAAGI